MSQLNLSRWSRLFFLKGSWLVWSCSDWSKAIQKRPFQDGHLRIQTSNLSNPATLLLQGNKTSVAFLTFVLTRPAFTNADPQTNSLSRSQPSAHRPSSLMILPTEMPSILKAVHLHIFQTSLRIPIQATAKKQNQKKKTLGTGPRERTYVRTHWLAYSGHAILLRHKSQAAVIMEVD